jgi:outer membrane protein assembly factor BamB
MTRSVATIVCAAVLTLGAQQPPDAWPQFLGPHRNGHSSVSIAPHATLAVAWRAAVSGGNAGLAVAGGRVYTLGVEGESDFLFALDAASGREVWRAQLGPSAGNGEPGSTPAVVANVVIAVSTACVVHAVAAQSGKPVWQRNMVDEYKARFTASGRAGCLTSPVIAGDRVVIPTGAPAGPRLVAFDAASGTPAWTADTLPNSLNGSAGYALVDGTRTILYHHAKPTGTSGVSAINADTGAVAWQVDVKEGMSDTMPIALSGNRVLLQTWKNSTLFDVSAELRPAWTSADISAIGPPPVHHNGFLYAWGGNSGEFFRCVDASTGQVRWSERIYRGFPVTAGDTLVILSEGSGLLRLVSADPAAYRERARLQVLKPGARTAAPPSLAGGRIFVRNLEEVVAVAIR